MSKETFEEAKLQVEAAVAALVKMKEALEASRAQLDKEKRIFEAKLKSERDVLQQSAVAELGKAKESLDRERQELQREREALEKEKTIMNSLEEGSVDLVELNIGGELVTVRRSTLCLVEGSLLATMFSGRWEESLVRDSSGRVFLDFDPKQFLVALNHLRHITYADTGFDCTLVPQPKTAFWDMVEYLGLRKVFRNGCKTGESTSLRPSLQRTPSAESTQNVPLQSLFGVEDGY